MFGQTSQPIHYKPDYIVGALSALMTRGLIARPLRQLCGDIFPLPLSWALEDNVTRTTIRINNLGYMIDDLPSKEQCETLIWTYMRRYHTIFSTFSQAVILETSSQVYRKVSRKFCYLLWNLKFDFIGALYWFMSRANGSSRDVDLQFFALLCTVLFAGCAICSRKVLEIVFGGQSRGTLSSLSIDERCELFVWPIFHKPRRCTPCQHSSL